MSIAFHGALFQSRTCSKRPSSQSPQAVGMDAHLQAIYQCQKVAIHSMSGIQAMKAMVGYFATSAYLRGVHPKWALAML